MGFGQMEHLPRAELQLSRQKWQREREDRSGGKCWEEKASVEKGRAQKLVKQGI